jgi:hypothetical protein
MSLFRRAGAAFLRVLGVSADPAAEADRVIVYAKTVSGVTQLFIRASDGTVTQLTPAASGRAGVTGDGSDGDVVLGAGTTTLARDMFYNSLEIPVGSNLAPDGYRIFVKGTLTLNGTINRDGLPGASTGHPAAGGTGFSTANRSLGGSASGGNGNAGAGTAGTASNPTAPLVTASGGAGGAGTNIGGAGGVSTPVVSPSSGGLRVALWSIEGRASGVSAQIAGGAGGGGGGGTFGGPGVGSSGGGGGAGGGYVVVSAGAIIGTGSITANGGAGGNGHPDGVSAAAAGGGGGGNGGIVAIYSANNTFPPTMTANGGAGGGVNGAGVAGAAGAVGGVYTFSG